jgi:hypothetical protein
VAWAESPIHPLSYRNSCLQRCGAEVPDLDTFRSLVIHDYHRPEEASASNVTDVGVAVQLLMQKLAQIFAVLANILDEVIFSYDSLNF